MNILALDTADKILSAALETEDGLWYSEVDASSRHSELLMECIDWLFKSAGLSPLELNMVSCLKGPGSFTGLRIAYSAAKGLAMGAGIPLVSIPTLDCLALPFSTWPALVLPVIDAKKSCFFAAFFREGKRISDVFDISPESLSKLAETIRICSDENIILTGSGADLLFSRFKTLNFIDNIYISPNYRQGMAKELLILAKNRSIIDNMTDIDTGPEYLRKSDAEY